MEITMHLVAGLMCSCHLVVGAAPSRSPFTLSRGRNFLMLGDSSNRGEMNGYSDIGLSLLNVLAITWNFQLHLTWITCRSQQDQVCSFPLPHSATPSLGRPHVCKPTLSLRENQGFHYRAYWPDRDTDQERQS
ncbi:hypothetical protein B0O80DRAFT_295944 [Mortierella sp. GBAus27b]|nr:hypothetical protein B0O80DRAFT_295944 [Mortierella sp. GBAus27b]